MMKGAKRCMLVDHVSIKVVTRMPLGGLATVNADCPLVSIPNSCSELALLHMGLLQEHRTPEYNSVGLDTDTATFLSTHSMK